MKSLFFLAALSLSGFLAICIYITTPVAAGESKFVRSTNPVPGQYIVVLEPQAFKGEDMASRSASASFELAGTYKATVDQIYDKALSGFAGKMTEEDAIELSRDPRVRSVEEDSWVSASAVQSNPTWGLDRIDQRSYPLNNRYQYTANGTGVNAYVIDSGIRTTHQDFGGRASLAADFTGDGQGGADCFGHGTHVAGTIGSSTYGVAKNVRLYGLKVLTCDGNGTTSNIIAAVNWISANRVLPAVANISITLSGPSSSLDTAINNSIASGVTYTVSAGNWGADACIFSPARVSNALTVGSAVTTGSADFRMGYSDFGPCVDLFAPGNGIVSTSHLDDVSSRSMNGTSMAAPHVAGVAALYLQNNPTASPAVVSQVIKDGATTGTLTNIEGTDSPSKMLYSWVGGATPPPPPTSITIIKEVTNMFGGTSSTTNFGFAATNLGTSAFGLIDNDAPPADRYVETNSGGPESSTEVVVTESAVPGWNVNSIQCVETAGEGTTNIQNTVVDLTTRKATIRAEQGEQITCTFHSQELIPTAANAIVSGRVVDGFGRGVKGVSISLTNLVSGERIFAISNSFGYYVFYDQAAGAMYTVSANSKRYLFEPESKTFLLENDLSDADFVASTR